MVWSVAGLLRFSSQSMQNETATQTAESAMQSSNCIAMTAMHFLTQKLVPDYGHEAPPPPREPWIVAQIRLIDIFGNLMVSPFLVAIFYYYFGYETETES